MEKILAQIMLERTAGFLNEKVLPEIENTWLKNNLSCSINLLKTLAVSVEEKGKDLMKENGAMINALKSVQEALEGESGNGVEKINAALIKKIKAEIRMVESDELSFAQENQRLKVVLVDAIRGLGELADIMPEEKLLPLRNQIRSAIRIQLDNRMRRILESGV